MNHPGKPTKLRPLWYSILLIVLLGFAIGNAHAQPVALVSPEAKEIVGDQLKSFQVDADGVIGTTKDRELTLNTTEGKSFKLSGQVWLGGPSQTSRASNDTPDGFAIFPREANAGHRYQLTSRALIVKRVKLGGVLDNKIDQVANFPNPALGVWLPFSAEVTAGQINFTLADQHGAITGPLDTAGANKISLVAGTKLKDLQLEILVGSPDQPPSAPAAGNDSNNDAGRPAARRKAPAASTQTFLDTIVIIKGDVSEGTGFVVKKSGQLCVVTNQHVLDGNLKFTITGMDGTQYPTDGQLFGAVGYDVAMLRIKLPDGSPAAANFIDIADNSDTNVKIGDPVAVMGNAEGGGVITSTTGSILGVGPELIEVNAKFIHGNSGSPIIDNATHQVIGIATYVMENYTRDELQKAANEPSLRWFGYRLDTIKQWETLDWKNFVSQSIKVNDVKTRTAAFIKLFQQLIAPKPGLVHFDDNNIEVAYANFLSTVQRASNKRDVLIALKQMMTKLTPYLDNDTDDLARRKLYSYFDVQIKAQVQIRAVIRKAIEDTISNVETMT